LGAHDDMTGGGFHALTKRDYFQIFLLRFVIFTDMKVLIVLSVVLISLLSYGNSLSLKNVKWLKNLATIGVSLNIATYGPVGIIPPAFADAVPVVGAPAPAFSLPSNAGKTISLADIKGKRTVLYFYPVSTTIC
jgi:cytochrome oxidase Cu insertion factor (SCO1/SenC/PrrC family)